MSWCRPRLTLHDKVGWINPIAPVYFGGCDRELGRNKDKLDKNLFKSINTAGFAFPHQAKGEFGTK